MRSESNRNAVVARRLKRCGEIEAYGEMLLAPQAPQSSRNRFRVGHSHQSRPNVAAARLRWAGRCNHFAVGLTNENQRPVRSAYHCGFENADCGLRDAEGFQSAFRNSKSEIISYSPRASCRETLLVAGTLRTRAMSTRSRRRTMISSPALTACADFAGRPFRETPPASHNSCAKLRRGHRRLALRNRSKRKVSVADCLKISNFGLRISNLT